MKSLYARMQILAVRISCKAFIVIVRKDYLHKITVSIDDCWEPPWAHKNIGLYIQIFKLYLHCRHCNSNPVPEWQFKTPNFKWTANLKNLSSRAYWDVSFWM